MSSKRVTSRDILDGPIGPIVFRMMVPMIFGIFAAMTFQLVDTYFVSLLGTQELAALGFVAPVAFTVVNLAIGLSIATSVMVGQAIGQGAHNRAARITTETILLALLVMVLVSWLGVATIDPLFRLLGASPGTIVLIHEYLDIWYVFAALLIIPMLANGAIRATGDTKWPSILLMISGLINVILDPIFIFGWGPVPAMGIRGAAWATVCGWSFGFCTALSLLYFREKLLVFALPPKQELFKVWGRVIKLAAPISIANMLSPITMVVLTAMISSYGESAVAAFGAGVRVEALAFVVALAATAALSPYMSQNLGAGNIQRAKTALSLTLRRLMIFQLLAYAVLFILASPIAGLFSEDPEVISTTTLYLRIMPLGLAAYCCVIVFNTAYNAAHQSYRTMLVSIIRLFVLLIPAAWLGSHFFGIPGFFAGAVMGNLLTVVVALRFYQRMNLAPSPQTVEQAQ
ncbi:MAG: MATE family efflux transporter [Pseudomonadota bacterium]